MLSDPVHATAAKAEPRSSTGQSQSFSRLFHKCASYFDILLNLIKKTDLIWNLFTLELIIDM